MRLGYFRHKEMHVNLVNNKRHVILGRMKSESESGLVVSDYLWPSPWDSPGQNTGVGSISLLQGIFPTQGLNPRPPNYRQTLYQLSHKEKKSEVAQSYPTLCDLMDYSLSGSSIHGIFQTRILDWVAISFSRGYSWPRNRTQVSSTAGRCFTIWATREAQCIRLLVTPLTVAHQAPLSIGFSRQEYWSG